MEEPRRVTVPAYAESGFTGRRTPEVGLPAGRDGRFPAG
ncbi:hypothetical protein QF030_005301 [Streptomyces rishiriensis]|uniref:Uncharacterized protein n=1 Tax=Streptomyces rishiriensis TaxID=68264 RepID=A0ABU0NWI6_STRRH|nr:hypothetical protein [Streptomyces rishiriensis]